MEQCWFQPLVSLTLLSYVANFLPNLIIYALQIHDLTYQIWKTLGCVWSVSGQERHKAHTVLFSYATVSGSSDFNPFSPYHATSCH